MRCKTARDLLRAFSTERSKDRQQRKLKDTKYILITHLKVNYTKKKKQELWVGIRQKALSFYSKVSILVRKRITMITCEIEYKFKLRVFPESYRTLVAGC